MNAIKTTFKAMLILTVLSSSAITYAESRLHTSAPQESASASARLKITIKVEPRLSMHLSPQSQQVRSNTQQKTLLSKEQCSAQQRCSSQPDKPAGLIYTSTAL